MASCETAVRKYLDDSTGWTAEEVADFVGAATYRIFSLA
jgi:hypothetical protein